MENKLNESIYKTGKKQRIKHMVFKSLKQKDLLEKKFITMIYYSMMHLSNK